MTTPSSRSLAISLAALALVAGPTWSARVVQVRIGEHPTFTRVVFELDGKAGYQIERREVEGEQELVVTLDAASKPRQLRSKSPMISGVEVEPSGDDAVARVRLRRPAGLVKEMILASPPRIVLDLVLPEDLARAAAAPKRPAARAAAAPATGAERSTPEPIVVARKDATETPRPERKPAAGGTTPGGTKMESAPQPRPAAKPAVAPEVKAAPTPEKTLPPQAVEAPAPSPRPVAAPSAPAPGTGSAPAAGFDSALEGERIVEPKQAPAEGRAETAEAAPAPVAPVRPEPVPTVAKPTQPVAPKPIAKAPTAPGRDFLSAPFGIELGGSKRWLALGLVGAGVLLFAFVVTRLLRRPSRPTSLDAFGAVRSQGEPEGMADSFEADAGAGFGTGRDAFPAAGPGLFDDEGEKGDMDMAAQLPIERERARLSQPPAGPDSEIGPLVRELERRLGQLESRLDQVNEARERLERQVTAQSEELRVQRAAIARTQRALRGMNRTGEEQATEPALRDPSKPPTGPR